MRPPFALFWLGLSSTAFSLGASHNCSTLNPDILKEVASPAPHEGEGYGKSSSTVLIKPSTTVDQSCSIACLSPDLRDQNEILCAPIGWCGWSVVVQWCSGITKLYEGLA